MSLFSKYFYQIVTYLSIFETIITVNCSYWDWWNCNDLCDGGWCAHDQTCYDQLDALNIIENISISTAYGYNEKYDISITQLYQLFADSNTDSIIFNASHKFIFQIRLKEAYTIRECAVYMNGNSKSDIVWAESDVNYLSSRNVDTKWIDTSSGLATTETNSIWNWYTSNIFVIINPCIECYTPESCTCDIILNRMMFYGVKGTISPSVAPFPTPRPTAPRPTTPRPTASLDADTDIDGEDDDNGGSKGIDCCTGDQIWNTIIFILIICCICSCLCWIGRKIGRACDCD